VSIRQTHSLGLLRQTAIEELVKIKDAGTWKSERVITSKQGSLVTVEGHPQQNILNFCSNNYLGLAVSNVHITQSSTLNENYTCTFLELVYGNIKNYLPEYKTKIFS
jgi:7-keto-8-aminopelargonate synthetase-like enzyme